MQSDRFTICLWFDTNGEEAARFYTGIFKNGRIGEIARYTKEVSQVAGQPEGMAMTVPFELDGRSFLALNGGPHFKFNEAISLVVNVETQDELDYYWNTLSEGGDPKSQQCGWLKDKFGVSWQIVPSIVPKIATDPVRGARAMAAIMQMKKLDIAAIEKAAG